MSALDKDLEFCDPRCDVDMVAERMFARFRVLVETLISIRKRIEDNEDWPDEYAYFWAIANIVYDVDQEQP